MVYKGKSSKYATSMSSNRSSSCVSTVSGEEVELQLAPDEATIHLGKENDIGIWHFRVDQDDQTDEEQAGPDENEMEGDNIESGQGYAGTGTKPTSKTQQKPSSENPISFSKMFFFLQARC